MKKLTCRRTSCHWHGGRAIEKCYLPVAWMAIDCIRNNYFKYFKRKKYETNNMYQMRLRDNDSQRYET